eukprot:4160062-Amphidinium_carterae.2
MPSHSSSDGSLGDLVLGLFLESRRTCITSSSILRQIGINFVTVGQGQCKEEEDFTAPPLKWGKSMSLWSSDSLR